MLGEGWTADCRPRPFAKSNIDQEVIVKFVNNAKYIEDQTKIAEFRPKHRDYLAGLMKDGKVAAAGPYADGSGTLIIYDVANIDEANAIVAADPFTSGGIFVSCEVIPWTIVFSKPDMLVPAADSAWRAGTVSRWDAKVWHLIEHA